MVEQLFAKPLVYYQITYHIIPPYLSTRCHFMDLSYSNKLGIYMFFQNAQCIFGPKAQELVQSSGKRGQELAKSSVRWMLKKAGANAKPKEREF